MPLYLLAWAAMPGDSSARGLGRSRRSAVEVALGVGLLAISAMLALRGLGLWISDAVTWPLALVAGGVALLWRGGIGARPRRRPSAHRSPRLPAPVEPAERVANVSRQGLGAALLVAAGLVFLQATGSLSAARDVILAALVVAVGPGAHLRAVDAAHGPLAHRRARGAHPLAGARGARRAPARLRPADARPHAEARRRPARGRRARPRPGARAARVAGRPVAGGGRAQPRRGAGGGGRGRRAAPSRPGRRRSPSATPISTPRARRSSPPRARPWSTRRSSARAPRSRSTPRRPTTRCRCSCAIAAPASIPRASPRIAAGCGSPSSGAWHATADARR